MMKGAPPIVSRVIRSPRILAVFIFALVFLGSSTFSFYHLGWRPDSSILYSPTNNKHDEHTSPGPQAAVDGPGNPNPVQDLTETQPVNESQQDPLADDINPFRQTIQYFKDFEFKQHPYQHSFGDQGARTKVVRNWLIASQETADPRTQQTLSQAVEEAIQILYPFMRKLPTNPDSSTPLADLRSTYEPGSTGIVITAGDPIVRFAAHLIVSIRSVLRSNLLIQVFYGGDSDLSPAKRKWLSSLIEFGPPLEFVDITTQFDQSTLQFDKAHGGWAMKPFAMLASRFENVILLDADAVLLQTPEAFFSHPAFLRSGALLFHDRLLWKGGFKGRHDWWKENIKSPGPQLAKSLVWTEEYAEEGDSGVIVLDKGRVDVLMGLLHICWQNSFPVRESITYKITYGDKESYWFGLELTGAGYEFEKHYGAMLGWENDIDTDHHEDEEQKEGEDKGEDPNKNKTRICSFTIAHLDEDDKLLWYNGGLLKNKLLKDMEDVYEVPNKWMVDAEWIKGNKKEAFSCMRGGPEEVHDITDWERTLLESFIERAKWVDGSYKALGW
ncbi:mannosyltransferase putative domain containing protein [Rhypophila sp. PSN 637]